MTNLPPPSYPKAKLLVLVLSSDRAPWSQIQEEGQDETFMSSPIPGVTFLRYSGGEKDLSGKHSLLLRFKHMQTLLGAIKLDVLPPLSRLLARLRFGDETVLSLAERANTTLIERVGKTPTLITAAPGDWYLTPLKVLLALEWSLRNYDFDYLFKMNSSAYLDAELLLKELEGFPTQAVYAGVIGKAFRSDIFCSGAGTLLSRDTVERICRAKNRWRFGLIEDVGIGDVLGDSNRDFTKAFPLRRLTIDSLAELEKAEDATVRSHFHFRCKSKSADETIRIMRRIWAIKSGG